MKRFYITIKGGNVQRCGFRKIAVDMAQKMSLTGKATYVNHHIVIEAEGDAQILENFLSWCQKGPRGCMVDSVEHTEIPVKGSTVFEVIHGVVIKDTNPVVINS